MKNIWKLSLILTMALCLAIALFACDDKLEEGFVYITDEAGETVLDERGNPATALDEDGDGQPDTGTSETTQSTESTGDISTDKNWTKNY